MNHQNRTNLIFYLIILVISGVGVYFTLKGFLSLIAFSFTYVLAIYPIYRWFTIKHKLNKGIATFITMFLSFIIILVPLGIILNSFIRETISLIQSLNFDFAYQMNTSDWLHRINDILRQIPGINYQLTISNVQDFIQSIARPTLTAILNSAISVSSSSITALTNGLIFLFIVATTLPSLHQLFVFIKELSPFGNKIDHLFIERISTVTKTMLKSVFMISFAQGIVGGLVLLIAGIPYVVLLSIIMTIFAILPIVGTANVTIPIAIWQLLIGNVWGALFILFGQFVLMTGVDNILRSYFVFQDDALHPALFILSIFGGLNTFGFLGFIYGPIIMVIFITTIEIISKNMKTGFKTNKEIP